MYLYDIIYFMAVWLAVWLLVLSAYDLFWAKYWDRKVGKEHDYSKNTWASAKKTFIWSLTMFGLSAIVFMVETIFF